MIVALGYNEWKLLRYVVRAEAASRRSVPGRELRLDFSRATRDGTFLDRLVEQGLIAVAGKAPKSTPSDGADRQPQPVQFRTHYRLTDLGRHAAEYGEYDRSHHPESAPLTGAVAELFKSLGRIDKSARRAASRGGTDDGKG